ncbi:hypothetical protein PMG11_03861 [Penicillium brasilianum]|uniref:Uncharacterized protein n=1 Tax=Penicillium brasilianum TaxID=104259 RepID=A0A0F7VIB6_PENBI|nr:hypothetical protein PMG11_03861 [Penicillium brasilianum]
MNTTFDEEPVWITNDDALSETSDISDLKEPIELPEPPKPERPQCGEILRIARPESLAIDTEGSCLLWFKPTLSFQLQQCSFWNQGSKFPIFNIWRPASYFGATFTQLGPNPVKLNSNDLIVTSSEEDTEILKSSDMEAIPLVDGNVVAAIDIDRPGYFCCSVCFSYRGRVILANGERWKFNEIDIDHHDFTREYDQKDSYSKSNAASLVWMFYHSSRPELMNGVPDDLPFAMDIDTRICRVKRSSNCADPGSFGGPVLAVMNRNGIICCEGIEKNKEIETDNIRELVLMTALAVAQYERWLQV